MKFRNRLGFHCKSKIYFSLPGKEKKTEVNNAFARPKSDHNILYDRPRATVRDVNAMEIWRFCLRNLHFMQTIHFILVELVVMNKMIE